MDYEWSDLDVLRAAGLIQVLQRQGQNTTQFVVSPRGFAYWEALQHEKGGPTQRMESAVRSLFDQQPTSGPYRAAFVKWSAAEKLLYVAKDTPDDLTTVGHLCREAMQEFADAWARGLGYESPEDVAKTKNRVAAGVAVLRDRLPESYGELLDALDAWWSAVNGLVQRQEHGAKKEGEPIGWDDARLVVTQTAMVMFGLVRAAARASR